ncbi:hypothetical protein [Mucisphaera calidilacus]|uniref:PEP-CTERM protein-sorting domain-containing protein n=1 Tax=Mucisphaera calidilacus TaxID=2527982 RepID=A0A518BWI7_9BACT|nr:hypothetical protein [Mucisphaera calidilacus]QDU71338.1 hypothetical protein Pan265_11870 [Mucisphaera calidilacus]
MFKTTAAALTVACCLTSAEAEYTHPDVVQQWMPAPTLPGYITYTAYLRGSLLGFNAATITIQDEAGVMNQVEAFGQKGLFADDGIFAFVPSTVIEDTYFLFDRPALLVDGSFGEYATGMEASFAYAEPVTTEFGVIQILVAYDATQIPWMTIELAYPGGSEIVTAYDAPIGRPEPASGALFGVAGLALLRRR